MQCTCIDYVMYHSGCATALFTEDTSPCLAISAIIILQLGFLKTHVILWDHWHIRSLTSSEWLLHNPYDYTIYSCWSYYDLSKAGFFIFWPHISIQFYIKIILLHCKMNSTNIIKLLPCLTNAVCPSFIRTIRQKACRRRLWFWQQRTWRSSLSSGISSRIYQKSWWCSDAANSHQWPTPGTHGWRAWNKSSHHQNFACRWTWKKVNLSSLRQTHFHLLPNKIHKK